ncbi:MAG: hypothetical protein FWG27_08470 [Treponema sp.]|nr:hypothetical protein [Treponema sp.]
MPGSTDWMDESYRESYEEELRGIRRRLASDPSCSAEDLQGTLKNLYIMEGSDWQGRGEVQNTSLAAIIAAYETVIGELQNDGKTVTP